MNNTNTYFSNKDILIDTLSLTFVNLTEPVFTNLL